MPDPVPFPFEPDGGSPVVYSFAYATAVIGPSETGREQRSRLRSHPVGGLSFDVVAFGNEAQTLMATLFRSHPVAWAVPLFPFEMRTTVDAAPGATSLTGNFYNQPILDEENQGQWVLLVSSYQVFELVKITGFSAFDTLALENPLVGTWPAGSRLYAVRIGRLEPSIRLARLGDDGKRGTLNFTFENTGPTLVGFNDPDPATEFDFGNVLEHVEPEGGADVDEDFERSFEVFDGTIGARAGEVYDAAGPTMHVFRWIVDSFAVVIGSLQWIAQRRGRAVPFWLPPWQREFELAEDVVSGASSILIKSIGYAANLFPGTGARRHLCFRSPDGTFTFADCGAAVDNLDGTETLTLVDPIGADVPKDTPAGFRRFMRLDSDSISISFEGPEHAEITLPLRELPNEAPAPEVPI